jgi:hypothetical protein
VSRLIHFQNASRFHDGRLLLTLGEPLGAFAIDVDATELLAVMVIHGNLPVAMFAPAILVEPAGTFCFCLRRLLFHDEIDLNARDYRKFDLAAQVARRRLTFLLFNNYN